MMHPWASLLRQLAYGPRLHYGLAFYGMQYIGEPI